MISNYCKYVGVHLKCACKVYLKSVWVSTPLAPPHCKERKAFKYFLQ